MCRRARLRRLTTLKRDAKISLRPVPQLEKLKFLHDWGAEIRVRRMPPHKVAAVACWVLVAPKWAYLSKGRRRSCQILGLQTGQKNPAQRINALSRSSDV
jgi:hypothetical protein